MQITVDISGDFVTRAEDLGLTSDAYACELLGTGRSTESEWEAEALQRANEIDAGRTQLVPWDAIQTRLRSQIAG